MFCFSCYLALELEKYLQYSIDIATEQSFRYIELIDAKIGVSKMRHYVRFSQIGSHYISLKFSFVRITLNIYVTLDLLRSIQKCSGVAKPRLARA